MLLSLFWRKWKCHNLYCICLKYVLLCLNSVVPHLCIAPRRNTKTQRSRAGTTSKNKAYMHKKTYARTYILRREYQHCKSSSRSSYFLACTYITSFKTTTTSEVSTMTLSPSVPSPAVFDSSKCVITLALFYNFA